MRCSPNDAAVSRSRSHASCRSSEQIPRERRFRGGPAVVRLAFVDPLLAVIALTAAALAHLPMIFTRDTALLHAKFITI